jgi:alpha-amylase/alpha-mannosidase (GH57 family)
MSTEPLNVVLCWHMHQPVYRLRGRDEEPWTWLHGIKDYADMAAHLEAVPGARAVVNFSPVLLEHLVSLAAETRAAASRLDAGDEAGALAALRDPLLSALVHVPDAPDERMKLLRRCLQVHPRTMLGRFPAYARLAELVQPVLEAPVLLRHLAPTVFEEMLEWFVVAWFGEARRRTSPLLQRLQRRLDASDARPNNTAYTRDRHALLHLIADELGTLLPRWRALQDEGRVELAMSPWGHPILPLLLDLQAGRESLPDSAVPEEPAYPGGEVRARWHIERGRRTFETLFGRAPAGCWPSEGAVSRGTIELLARSGFRWAASGGAVLRRSVREASQCEHATYRLPGVPLRLFFRDDGLSDAIGFTYQGWSAEAAVDDLLHHLLNIRALCPSRDAVVPIVLDGENAWEYYPENGYAFLRLLYERLAAHPKLKLVTFAEHLDGSPRGGTKLETLRAGSWVHGDLSTWIGNAPRNRAWSLLIAAKTAFDATLAPPAGRAVATELLAACECSDWFWWLSEHQNADALARFDALFRKHLGALYQALGVPPPPSLDVPLAVGDVHAQASAMLRAE